MIQHHTKTARVVDLGNRSIIFTWIFSLILFTGNINKPALAGSDDFQIWSPVYLTYSFTDTILGWYEVQPRFGDNASQVNQLLLRTALGYRVTKHLSLWQGYAWTPSFDPGFVNENRIYQQMVYAQGFQAVDIMSRTRLEQRWIQHVPGTAVRFRTLLRGRFPLDDARLWGLVTQNEIFFNLNSPTNGPGGGFDQNRFFVGLNKKINEHLSVDGGYQLQAINTDESSLFNTLNHILLLQFFFNR